MNICGHSFGGYLACNYAIKFPEYINKCFLVSPIGIKETHKKC